MMQGHGHLHRQRTEKKKSEPVKQAEAGEMQAPEAEVETSAEQVMYLQRTIGNQATKRFLQAKRSSLIQRNGEGGAPAPAPAIDPATAIARIATMETECNDAFYAAQVTGDPSQSAISRALIARNQTELEALIATLKGQPTSEAVNKAIDDASNAAIGIDFTLNEIDNMIHGDEVESVTFHSAPSGAPPTPPPTSTPPSTPPPTRTPVPTPASAPVPADPGLTKMEKAKGAYSGLGVDKIQENAGLIAGQDREALAENALKHEREPVPDPDGTKTAGLFAPLRAAGEQVKSVAAGAAESMFGWLEPLFDFIKEIPGVKLLTGLILSGKSAHGAYGRRKVFSAALKTSNDRVAAARTPTKTELEMQKSAQYAFNKTNRAFWENVGKFISNLAEYILRLITILTGGASALVTETGALLIDIGQAVLALGHKVKGGFKKLFGIRGRNRRINATTVYNHARKGDPVALKLVLDLKPHGTFEKLKAKLPRTAKLPATESEMQAYLMAHTTSDEQKAIIMEIANKMKST